MSFRPNLTRKRQIFATPSSALGFFACLALCFVTAAAVAGFAKSTVLPEISLSIVYFACLFTAAAMGCGFLFSAEWIVYPALILQGMGILFVTFLDVSDALSAKIDIIVSEIIRYEPDYYIPYHDMGLTVAAALLAALCLMVFAHFLLRCRSLVPVLLASAVTIGLFVALERNDSAHFYIMILCIIAMLCVSVQGKAGKVMGSSLPITKIGVKTLAFLLAAVFVLLPVASNESFSKSLMDAISQLTGIKPPTVSPGGYGDASGDISMDGYEQFMNDLEEKQSSTELEDIEFDNILLYIISGANDGTNMFLRRRIHYDYSDNNWTLFSSDSAELTDGAFKALAETQRDLLSAVPNTRDFITIAGVVKPLYPAIPAGSTHISNKDDEAFHDLDKDGVKERYPAITTQTYRFGEFEDDAAWFDFLRSYTDIDWGYETFGMKDYENPEFYISGDELLDKELRALMLDILRRYYGYQSYEEWLNAEDSVIDAIEAVQIYLSETKFYTMNPQMSDRYQNYDHDKDSIYNFLFNTGEGYCVQFSSTAVLLLRSLGINTRYVTGYVSRGADFGGGRYVYDSNAHAWCEVELYGYGWVPFEMTDGAMLNSIGSDGPQLDPPNYPEEISQPEMSEQESSEEISEEVSEETSEESSESSGEISEEVSESQSAVVGTVSDGVSGDPKANKKAIIYCICISVCVIIVTLIVALVYRRNEKRRKRVYNARYKYSCGEGDPHKGLIELHTQHIKLLRLKGFTPLKGEKYPEYIKRICRSDPEMPNPSFAMEYFRKAEFGGKCTAEELKTAGKHILALNDYMFKNIGGFKKRRAYFKGLLTKPSNTKKE